MNPRFFIRTEVQARSDCHPSLVTGHFFLGLLLLLAALVMAFMAAPCRAGTLRGEVLLDKDVITVGDIFGDVGEAAAKVVGPAPAPGQKVVYDVMALSQVAKNFNLAWQPQSNYDRVTITRASQVISAAAIKERIAAELGKTGPEKDLDIALDNASLEVHRPTSEKLEWNLTDLSYDPVQHRFKGSLVVGSGSNADVIALAGRAMPTAQIAILNRALTGGASFSESAVDWVRVPVDKAGADAVTDFAQLKGMEARRALDDKSILRLRDLAKARLVLKGSLVTMQIVTPVMQISTEGRALSDGVMGETIRVLNTQSNRTIDAVVLDRNKVSVTPVSTNHVASN